MATDERHLETPKKTIKTSITGYRRGSPEPSCLSPDISGVLFYLTNE